MDTYQIISLVVYIISFILLIDLTKAISDVDYIHWKKDMKIPGRSKNLEFEKTMRNEFLKRTWNISTIFLIMLPLINTVWYLFLLSGSLFRAAKFSSKPILIDVIIQQKSLHAIILKKWDRPKWMKAKFKEYLKSRESSYLKNRGNGKE